MRRVALFVLAFLAFGVLPALAQSSAQFPQAPPGPVRGYLPLALNRAPITLIACGIRGWIGAARF